MTWLSPYFGVLLKLTIILTTLMIHNVGSQNESICRRNCTQNEFDVEACSCDRNCQFFGECCSDRHEPDLFPWPGTCVMLRFGNERMEGIKLVTRCIKKHEQSLSQLCENISTANVASLIPIYDMSQNLSFRNIYCAICHNVKVQDMLMWSFNVDVDCAKRTLFEFNLSSNVTFPNLFKVNKKYHQIVSLLTQNMSQKSSSKLPKKQELQLLDMSLLQRVIKWGKCEVGFSFVNVTKCDDRLIKSSCADHLALRCAKSAQSIVVSSMYYYRNRWCAACDSNSDMVDLNKCKIIDKRGGKGGYIPKRISLSALLDFNFMISDLVKPFYSQNVTDNTTNISANKTKTLSASEVISLSSTSVSMTTILLFTVLLAFNPELQKRNSIMVFILGIYIFITNVLYIFIAAQNVLLYSKEICFSIAVANHLFNINSFLWSLFISVDICGMLYQSSSGRNTNISLKRMFAISFSSSALVTGCALISDFAAPEWIFSPKFGAPTCWINSFRGHILFYYAPAFLITLTNLISFNFSAYLLAKASQERRKLQNTDHNMTSHKITLKIALITGLPNIVAFTHVFIPYDSNWKVIMDNIYSAIYGLQGFFLIVCYCSSKNIQNVIKKSFLTEMKTDNISSLSSRTS